MIRIVLAGCGEHSRASHAAPLARFAAAHPNEIKLVAACDLNWERALEFCHSFGFARVYEDFEQMLEVERPDACVSVMPMEKIGEVGIKLLERRIPCVIEKPLGTSLPEIERLAVVARETQTPHMVSVNRRFMPYLNQARGCSNMDHCATGGHRKFVTSEVSRTLYGRRRFMRLTLCDISRVKSKSLM